MPTRGEATTLVACLQFSLIVTVQAVNAGCECIVFDSTYGKQYGIFTSPNWPHPYDTNIDCLLYTFIGKEDEIVEIAFDEFDVQRTKLECIYGDYVKLYLHLEEPSINEQTQWNTVLCGRVSDIEQTYYSSQYGLVFEFHTDWQRENSTGFRGTFRFIKKNLFQTDGELVEGSLCNYEFVSGSIIGHKGRFYSPQYPSSYPLNIKCSYLFTGRYNERITIVFELVRLQRTDLSCLTSPDVIIIHDGKDSTSPVIGQLCNINTFVEFVSTGHELYIEFSSRSHFPGQGFRASFSFQEDNATLGFEIPSTEPDNYGKISQPAGPGIATANCDRRILSGASKNGTFTTPNYPDLYPSNTQCTFQFMGRGKERVQIVFTDFSLHWSEQFSQECDGEDTVTVFILINGLKDRVDNLCGNKVPAQLMSNGPSMTVEFRSVQNNPTATGFNAIYRFVSNFGITSGRQDQQAVCSFIYNSTDRANGSFTSPNWPGYYPRDTECHYFFYGRSNERVHITFAYFDVEGVIPCTSETASDYVEFSNFRTVDRKIPRHCGLKKPKVIDSDSDFFRITFKSNDRFDGTGFEAFYQFRKHEDPFTIKRVRSRSGLHTCYQSAHEMAAQYLLLLLIAILEC